MKKLLFITIVAIAFIGCKTEEPFKIDPNAMIYITEQTSAAKIAEAQRVKAEGSEHLTGVQIVEQTKEILFVNSLGNWARYFHENQRDLTSETPKLMMFATDVITEYGTLSEEFITCTDVVLVRWLDDKGTRDTIAYIPNAVLRTAEIAIRDAFGKQDVDACYELFNDAYKFIPITGEEWQALKDAGQN